MESDPLSANIEDSKRRNCSANTVKNHFNILDHFSGWLQVPLEAVTDKADRFVHGASFAKQKKAKTITVILAAVHAFFDYLIEDETMPLINPLKKYRLRLPRPLPKHLRMNR